jgi:glutathione S-transferase
VNAYVFPTMNRFMKERLVRPAMGIESDRAFIESAEQPLKTQMGLIDRALTDSDFLAGDTITIADSFLLPHLLFFGRTPEGGVLLSKSPAASAWLARMQTRPSFHGGMSRTYDAFALLQAKERENAWPA